MCGRFSFTSTEKKLVKHFPTLKQSSAIRFSYNIAPSQHAYVVTKNEPEKLEYMIWGLVPFWAKDNNASLSNINARSEGIISKPSFRVPIRQKRCLVLADSFYEWRKVGKQKFPYRFLASNKKLLFLGGIWDEWTGGNYPVHTFSIITTPANELVGEVHDRMPLILSGKKDIKKWLDPETSLEDMQSLFQNVDSSYLTKYRIGTDVNKVKNDDKSLHKKAPEILDLFSNY